MIIHLFPEQGQKLMLKVIENKGCSAAARLADRGWEAGLSWKSLITDLPYVDGDWPCQLERATFDPHRAHTPWPITKKIDTGDYIGAPTVQIRPWRLLGKSVKYNEKIS